MKVKLLFAILFAALSVACEKEEKVDKDTDPNKNEITFSPQENTIKINGSQLEILLKDGERTLEFITGNTNSGTYNVQKEQPKAGSSATSAVFKDETGAYHGISGTLTVEKGEKLYAITYHVKLMFEGEDKEIEIKSGNALNIEPMEEQTPVTAETVKEKLVAVYAKFEEYIRFSYLFDAVYANQTKVQEEAWNDIYSHTQEAGNPKVAELWNNAWQLIDLSNLIVKQATEVIPEDEGRNEIVAQAKVINAYVYFQLLRWFGGVPIVKGGELIVGARNSEEEVVSWIEKNITEALDNLATDNFYQTGEITQTFALGFQVRVALFKKDYMEAIDIATTIVKSEEHALDLDFNEFKEGNREIFWGFSKGNNLEFNAFYAKGNFVPALRLTETYLSLAETRLMIGDMAEALRYFNVLKARREEMQLFELRMHLVFEQYLKELQSEGEIFFTMKRFGNAKEMLKIPEFRKLLPIPLKALEINTDLVQNIGY